MKLKSFLTHLPQKTYFWLLLLLLLTLPAIKDLLMPGYFPMHDDFQIMRIQGMHQCFQDLQIPCRWIPDAGYGFGYPMFNYYPPFPYYLGEIFHGLGVNLFWTSKINFLLTFLLSGIFMYFLARRFFGHLGGFLAAVFYTYAPYHSVDIYVRGALNEAWGLVWFPLIFYATYDFITRKEKTLGASVLVAVSYAGLLLSHNVMTLIFTPLMALWVIFWLIQSRRFSRFLPLLLSGIWAIGLAAFFFLPVVLESRLVHVESMTVGYFNYLAHFADIKQMLFSRFWGYGASTWGPEDDMAFPVGHFHWILGGVIVGILSLFFILRRLLKRDYSKLALPLIVLILIPTGFFYVFLIHSKAVWFWDNLPLLYYAQFPWRLLAIPAFIFSFLSGSLFLFLKPKGVITWTILTVLTLGVILWNLPFFRAYSIYKITTAEKFSGLLWELQTTGGIFDYLPKAAARPPGDPSPILPQFVEGKGAITDFRSGSNWYTFTVLVSSDDSTLQLPFYDYPNWRILDNGKAISHTHEPDLGRTHITLGKGTHDINIRLTNTPIRTLGNLFSLLSFTALGITLLRLKKQS